MKNHKLPQITVIMYVKNGAPYFKRSLDSVINQTLQNIEIMIVDGGSTDGTLELAREVSQRDTRIRILLCDKGSVGAQFNMGLIAARGEYIGIVESDDYIFPEMYEKEYAYAKKMGFPDMLRADNYIFWGEENQEVRIRTRLSHDESIYGKLLSTEHHPQKTIVGGSFWTGIYKREFLIKYHIFENESNGAAYQDFGFLFQTTVLAKTICLMNDAFYCYRKDNPQSSCNRPIRINLIDKEYAFLREMLLKRRIWEKYDRYYYLWKIRNYRWFYRNLDLDEKKEVIPLMYESISHDLKEEHFPQDGWNKKEMEFIRAIVEGKEALIDYLLKDDKSWNISYEKFIHLTPLNKVCLFGAGNLASIILWYLKHQGIIPQFIVDNNKKRWGEKWNGIEIVSPDRLVDRTGNNANLYIIICSENYADEIKEQILGFGFNKRYIIECNDMDSCVRSLLRS